MTPTRARRRRPLGQLGFWRAPRRAACRARAREERGQGHPERRQPAGRPRQEQATPTAPGRGAAARPRAGGGTAPGRHVPGRAAARAGARAAARTGSGPASSVRAVVEAVVEAVGRPSWGRPADAVEPVAGRLQPEHHHRRGDQEDTKPPVTSPARKRAPPARSAPGGRCGWAAQHLVAQDRRRGGTPGRHHGQDAHHREHAVDRDPPGRSPAARRGPLHRLPGLEGAARPAGRRPAPRRTLNRPSSASRPGSPGSVGPRSCPGWSACPCPPFHHGRFGRPRSAAGAGGCCGGCRFPRTGRGSLNLA